MTAKSTSQRLSRDQLRAYFVANIDKAIQKHIAKGVLQPTDEVLLDLSMLAYEVPSGEDDSAAYRFPDLWTHDSLQDAYARVRASVSATSTPQPSQYRTLQFDAFQQQQQQQSFQFPSQFQPSSIKSEVSQSSGQQGDAYMRQLRQQEEMQQQLRLRELEEAQRTRQKRGDLELQQEQEQEQIERAKRDSLEQQQQRASQREREIREGERREREFQEDERRERERRRSEDTERERREREKTAGRQSFTVPDASMSVDELQRHLFDKLGAYIVHGVALLRETPDEHSMSEIKTIVQGIRDKNVLLRFISFRAPDAVHQLFKIKTKILEPVDRFTARIAYLYLEDIYPAGTVKRTPKANILVENARNFYMALETSKPASVEPVSKPKPAAAAAAAGAAPAAAAAAAPAAAGAAEASIPVIKVKKELEEGLRASMADAPDIGAHPQNRDFFTTMLQRPTGIDDAMWFTAHVALDAADMLPSKRRPDEVKPFSTGTAEEVLKVEAALYRNFGLVGVAPLQLSGPDRDAIAASMKLTPNDEKSITAFSHRQRQLGPVARSVVGGLEAATLIARDQVEALSDIDLDPAKFDEIVPVKLRKDEYRDLLRGAVIAATEYQGIDALRKDKLLRGLQAFKEFAEKNPSADAILTTLRTKFETRGPKSPVGEMRFAPLSDEEANLAEDVVAAQREDPKAKRPELPEASGREDKREGLLLAGLVQQWATPEPDEEDYANTVNSLILSNVWSAAICNITADQLFLGEMAEFGKKLAKQRKVGQDVKVLKAQGTGLALDSLIAENQNLQKSVEDFATQRSKRPFKATSDVLSLRPVVMQELFRNLAAVNFDRLSSDVQSVAHMLVNLVFMYMWIDHYDKLNVFTSIPYLSGPILARSQQVAGDATLQRLRAMHRAASSYANVTFSDEERRSGDMIRDAEVRKMEYEFAIQQPVDRTGRHCAMDYSDICLLVDVVLRMPSWQRLAANWGWFKDVNKMQQFAAIENTETQTRWTNAVNAINHCCAIERDLRLSCTSNLAQGKEVVWERLLAGTSELPADVRPNVLMDLFLMIHETAAKVATGALLKCGRIRHMRMASCLVAAGVAEKLAAAFKFEELSAEARLDDAKVRHNLNRGRRLLLTETMAEGKHPWPQATDSPNIYTKESAAWMLGHHYALHMLIDVHYRLSQLPTDKFSDGNATERIESVIKHLIAKIALHAQFFPTHLCILQLPGVEEALYNLATAVAREPPAGDYGDENRGLMFPERPGRLTDSLSLRISTKDQEAARTAINQIFKAVQKGASYSGAVLDKPLRLAIAVGTLLFPEWARVPLIQNREHLIRLLKAARDLQAKSATEGDIETIRTRIREAQAAKAETTDEAARDNLDNKIRQLQAARSTIWAAVDSFQGLVEGQDNTGVCGVYSDLEQFQHSGVLAGELRRNRGAFAFVPYADKQLGTKPAAVGDKWTAAEKNASRNMGYTIAVTLDKKFNYETEKRIPEAFLHWLGAPFLSDKPEDLLIMKTHAIARLEMLIDDLTTPAALATLQTDEQRMMWKYLRALVYIRCSTGSQQRKLEFPFFRDASTNPVAVPFDIDPIEMKAKLTVVNKVMDKTTLKDTAFQAVTATAARNQAVFVNGFVGARATT